MKNLALISFLILIGCGKKTTSSSKKKISLEISSSEILELNNKSFLEVAIKLEKLRGNQNSDSFYQKLDANYTVQCQEICKIKRN